MSKIFLKDAKCKLKPCFWPQKPGAKRKKHPKLQRFCFNNKHLLGSDLGCPKTPLFRLFFCSLFGPH